MPGKKWLSSLYLTSIFVLLSASSTLAAKKGDFFSVAGGDLLGLIAAIDGLLIAVAVFKIYHRMFSVFYFSLQAFIIELFWIVMISLGLLSVVPSLLAELGLWNAVTGYAYFIAIFLLSTGLAKKFWKAKKDS
ncbi:MAG: hypothetical protein IJQ74_01500 [Synergistaceae bacterium]|nr:hypothetical protein [Synergistaceae bacterium]